jgi:hypothetical protein
MEPERMRVVGIVSGLALILAGCAASGRNWYEKSFYLLHKDHHTTDRFEVGRDADPGKTARLVSLSRPGMQLKDWRFKDGRLEIDVPPFEIHQMVVIQKAR